MKRQAVTPHRDYGCFGPGSVTWRVFSYPTSLTVGFQRTVVTEMFEPFLLASVADTQAVTNRPALRYDRTMQYVSTIAFHDSEAAVKASDVLMRIHGQIRGKEPISGQEYDANAPDAQLWIHLTQWHSVLYTYENFGPGPLTPEEDAQYWAECRRAAEFQTINPEDVPRNRAEMRAYYARMRPHLAATENTQVIVDHLLDSARSLLEQTPWYWQPLRPAVRLLSRKATIATLPRWLRKMGGIQQGPIQDALVTTFLRALYRMPVFTPGRQLALLKLLSPQSVPVMAPIILGIPPLKPETVIPAEAWARAGKRLPREQYAEQVASRPARQPHKAPLDPGAGKLPSFA